MIADLPINRKSAIGVPENVLRGVVMRGPEAYAAAGTFHLLSVRGPLTNEFPRT